jgi:hypothetical protein
VCYVGPRYPLLRDCFKLIRYWVFLYISSKVYIAGCGGSIFLPIFSRSDVYVRSDCTVHCTVTYTVLYTVPGNFWKGDIWCRRHFNISAVVVVCVLYSLPSTLYNTLYSSLHCVLHIVQCVGYFTMYSTIQFYTYGILELLLLWACVVAAQPPFLFLGHRVSSSKK